MQRNHILLPVCVLAALATISVAADYRAAKPGVTAVAPTGHTNASRMRVILLFLNRSLTSAGPSSLRSSLLLRSIETVVAAASMMHRISCINSDQNTMHYPPSKNNRHLRRRLLIDSVRLRDCRCAAYRQSVGMPQTKRLLTAWNCILYIR